MKTSQIIACTLVLSLTSVVRAADPAFGTGIAPVPAATPSPEFLQLLQDGKAAYAKGDIEKAKADFTMAYEMDSRNQVAIAYLRRINNEEKYAPKTVNQERALAAVIIPKIEFKDATLREALDYLRKKVAEVSGGKQSVNFVIPSGEPTDSTRVTLSLSNVPFPEAVRYVGDVAKFHFTFDKYAISGKPIGETAVTATIPPAAPTQ